MQNLEPGQIVQVGGKDATVISVGDGIVHLEQDGQAISVSPGEITVPAPLPGANGVGDELPPVEEPSHGENVTADPTPLMAEIIAVKQRVAALEDRAVRIEKVLAALTAGPAKPSDDEKQDTGANAATPVAEPNSEAAPGEGVQKTGDAAASASE